MEQSTKRCCYGNNTLSHLVAFVCRMARCKQLHVYIHLVSFTQQVVNSLHGFITIATTQQHMCYHTRMIQSLFNKASWCFPVCTLKRSYRWHSDNHLCGWNHMTELTVFFLEEGTNFKQDETKPKKHF